MEVHKLLTFLIEIFLFLIPVLKADINRTGCNRTVEAGDVLANPLLTGFNKGRPYNCWFLVKPRANSAPKDVALVIVLKFQRFQWGQLVNATTCIGGNLQIYDGPTALHDSGNPGFYCGEIERSRLFISENNVVKLHFFAESYDDRYQFAVYTRQEQQQQLVERYGHHPPLYPHRRGQPMTPGSLSCDREFTDCRLQTCFVQSPNFPGVYPRNRRCLYHVSTRQPFIKLFTEDGEFNVDGQRCDNYIMCPLRPIGEETCPHDFIRVYDGNSESAVVIGTFCGIGRFPFSIVGTGTDLLLEFVSSAAGPLLNTGFHFNVDSWPGNVGSVFNQHMVHQPTEKSNNDSKYNPVCSYILTSASLESSGDSEGLFLSPMHWYLPNTVCTYLITGKPEQIVRVYFPTFRISKPDAPIRQLTGDCSESLTIYDGSEANPARIIKTFCDTFSKPLERKDFLSTGNSLFLRFHSRVGSYSGSSINFWAHYDFFNNSQPEGIKTADTDCDVVYEPNTRISGQWISPYNTLLYKRSSDSSDLKCRYTFQGNRRSSSRVMLTLYSVNLKSVTYPCADRLIFRDFKNDLTILDVNANRLKATGNYTSTRGKGYLCQLQFQSGNLSLPARVLSSTPNLLAALHIDALRSTSLYFKSSSPVFNGRYDFIHPLYICGSPRPNVTVDGVINLPQYFEDEDKISPLICAWDFVIQRENKRIAGNETAAMTLNIEVSGLLNLTRVQKISQCGDPNGNSVEVAVPGNEIPLLLLCTKPERHNDFYKGIRLREGFDDLDIMKETHYQPDVNYDYIKSPGFSTSLPLFPTKLPHHKAVVIVKLNNLKTSYGVRISWSAVH
uniref:CUB domain-containing protein n=1 Tax=Daphnia galeata TaxID=27404 RepID=A0A8J2S7W5_9CRUS|nr:unnamed protein product [Daphnia galeata]